MNVKDCKLQYNLTFDAFYAFFFFLSHLNKHEQSCLSSKQALSKWEINVVIIQMSKAEARRVIWTKAIACRN